MPKGNFKNLVEDLLALSSPKYIFNIAKARKQKTQYSSKVVKQVLLK